MKSAEIRRRFIQFYESRGHTEVPSASLVLDDPTLLFVNAGMVPFKPYFLGEATPPYDRAVSVQKCVRTLDIEEVGKTTRHASFFQMCGNFSFGDYFKEKAIPYAWELLTTSVEDGGFGLDPERLWVTVYLDDDESAQIWTDVVGVPSERVQRMGQADNYWSMGVPGPCGPCSEIYYDRGPAYGKDGGPIVDDNRFIELWNLVFMQNIRGEGDGKDGYEIIGELPAKNIDTGLGLERLAAVLQDVENIYEIDTSVHILEKAAELTGVHYGADETSDIALRVVADHARTGAFLISDGVTPGNEGRGFVLRRLLRRVIRNMRLLGCESPTLDQLLESAIAAMSAQYPDLEKNRERIVHVGQAEERVFGKTLNAGTQLFERAAAEVTKAGSTTLPGASAFALHDTYGFPIDLTLEMAHEAGLSVDVEGFKELMAEQRNRAKADAKSRKAGLVDTAVFRDLLDAHGATTWLAYETLTTESRVLGLLKDDAPVPALREGEVGVVFLDRTPFYAESGGQHADAGTLLGDGLRVEVLDVQRPIRDLVAHEVRVLEGELTLDMSLQAQVDPDWRRDARQAHSGTHVLHAALREVLGPDALQSGSFNRPGYLRLDFAWDRALTPGELQAVEHASNRAIRDDFEVFVNYMSLAQAKEQGALALFGETYGDEVRVVEIDGPWSRELCGGTHVEHTSQIGLVTLTSESSVGAGSRRIEAGVGLEGFGYLARERDLVRQLTELTNARPEELVQRVEETLQRLKTVTREREQARAQALRANLDALIGEPTVSAAGTVWVFAAPAGTGVKELRELALQVRDRAGDAPAAVCAMAETGEAKVSVIAAANPAAVAQGLTANALLQAALEPLGGRGGGKADIAQGGGSNPAAIDAAIAAVRAAAQNQV